MILNDIKNDIFKKRKYFTSFIPRMKYFLLHYQIFIPIFTETKTIHQMTIIIKKTNTKQKRLVIILKEEKKLTIF